MKARRFLIGFLIILILAIASIAGFNLYTNPFGIVPDRFYGWPSYNITENPRTAKISYLDQHHENYNAYIVGSSGASAFPIDTLNSLNGKHNYNLFYYGADMYDTKNTVDYIIENYSVDEILMPISFSAGIDYHTLEDDLNYSMDYRVEHTSSISYWMKYLFAHPQFGLDKIKAAREDSYFQKKFDVFIAEEGSYDKSLRDVEYIGSMDEYLENFPAFKNPPQGIKSMPKLEEAMTAVDEIKKKCDENGIKLTILLYPITEAELNSYEPEEIDAFYKELSAITEFWDFTYSSVSREVRYFYDPEHFRNDVGRMILYKIYGEDDKYLPSDFGHRVLQNQVRTLETVKGQAGISTEEGEEKDSHFANLPVLMLHNIDEDASNTAIITEEKLRSLLGYLKDEAYSTILYDDLYNYAQKGIPLPDKPIMITLDDGYKSNYEIVYPLLMENGQRATIFPIGSSFGKDTYKDTGIKIYEHFSLAQAKEMVDSGYIDIGSHSFDMHQSEKLEEDKNNVHKSMIRLENEREEDYIDLVRRDFDSFNQIYKSLGKGDVRTLAFPLGEYDCQLTSLLAEMGIESTFTIIGGNNTIIKGLPQTLYNLRRNNVSETSEIGEMLDELLSKGK